MHTDRNTLFTTCRAIQRRRATANTIIPTARKVKDIITMTKPTTTRTTHKLIRMGKNHTMTISMSTVFSFAIRDVFETDQAFLGATTITIIRVNTLKTATMTSKAIKVMITTTTSTMTRHKVARVILHKVVAGHQRRTLRLSATSQ